MKYSQERKDVFVSFIVLLLGLYMLYLSLTLEIRHAFFKSAAVYPLLISALFMIMAIVNLTGSIKRAGAPGLSFLLEYPAALIRDRGSRRVLMTILIIALYIFVGVAHCGFYLSSIILMVVIMVVYVRHVSPLLTIPGALAFIAITYYIFAVMFNLPIR